MDSIYAVLKALFPGFTVAYPKGLLEQKWRNREADGYVLAQDVSSYDACSTAARLFAYVELL